MSNTVRTPRNANKATSTSKAAVTVVEEEDQFTSMSGAEWIEQYGFSVIANIVSFNTNGYPFITFLHKSKKTADGKPSATNIYFSIGAADVINSTKPNEEGNIEVTAELMSQFQFSYASCASAPEGYAWKLSRKGGEGSKFQDASNVF